MSGWPWGCAVRNRPGYALLAGLGILIRLCFSTRKGFPMSEVYVYKRCGCLDPVSRRRSSIVLTADTYTSVLPCLAHQAAEASAALVLNAARKVSRLRRGRPKPNGRKQTTTRPRPRASVAVGDRIMEPTSGPHGSHTRSTPTSKIQEIKDTCWSASIQWVCAARDSNPNPLVKRPSTHGAPKPPIKWPGIANSVQPSKCEVRHFFLL
jgi:hypothetical protein